MTFASTKSRPSTNSHSTKINDDKSLWGHFPCRILLCYLPTKTQIFSPHKTLLDIFRAKILLCHLLQNPKSALSLSLSLSEWTSATLNHKNNTPQQKKHGSRLRFLLLNCTSSPLLLSSQLPTKRKPSNRSNQDRDKRKQAKKKGKKGRRGRTGEELQREKKKAKRKKNAIKYSPLTATTTEGTCFSSFFLVLLSLSLSLSLSLFFQLR